MPISKTLTAPNGATVTFHKAMHASVDVVAGKVALNVASWSNEADHNAGSGLVWMWELDMPMTALADIDGAVALVAPFAGGTVVSDLSASLDAEKVRAWARIKAARDAAMESGFTWDGSRFDSDMASVVKINGAFSLAMAAAQSGAEYSVDWTLADNTVRTLSGSDVIQLGLTLGAFVPALQDKGTLLRQQIADATSLDQLKAITWA